MSAQSVVDRRAARILLVDARSRVLLFQARDPQDLQAGSWWITPGGGLDGTESSQQAAARELQEETGLTVDPARLGPVVHQQVIEFGFAGRRYRQAEDFFLLRVPAHQVDTTGFTELEVAAGLGHRWWSGPELRATGERLHPEELVTILECVAPEAFAPGSGT